MLLAPLLSLALAASANNGLANPVHRSWGVPEGLPQSSVPAVVQGPLGWLYAGTQEGLARFDGYSWSTLPLMKSRPVCRPITSLAQDGERVWVGTHCGLYAVQGDALHEVTPLDSQNVNAVAAAPDGSVWIGTDHSLSRRSSTGRSQTLLTGNVRVLDVTSDGTWVAMDDHLRLMAPDGSVHEVEELAGKTVIRLAADHDVLWVGTLHDGLFEVRNLHARPLDGSPRTVSALLVDRDGTLWVGDRDGGLLRLEDGRLQPFAGFDGVPPLSMLEDREGSIWIGTSSHGLHQLRPAEIQNVGEREGLENPVSWSVAQDSAGTIWIGTENGRLVHLENGRPVVTPLPPSLAGASVFDLSFAPDGALWMATRKGWAVKRGDTLTPLGAGSGLPLGPGTVCARRDGSVWAGGPGLFKSVAGGAFERVAFVPAGVWVHALRETSDGTLWVGTSIGLFQLRGGQLRHYGEEDGLGGNRVLEISEDADRPGVVWTGGSDGISRIDERGHVESVRGTQGLSVELAFAIVDDGAGRLWLGTDRGIFRLDKSEIQELFDGKRQRVEAEEFGVSDGMRNPECNGYSTSSAMRSSDGQVWFATMGGAVHFSPDVLRASVPSAGVNVISASSGGKPLLDGGKLDPSDPKLEIHYVAPTFLDPTRIRYRYRLTGFDKEWVDAGARRYALYTNVPPGRFSFQVQAYVPGTWASSVSELSFVRPTRFTEHWAFYAAVVLLSLLLFGAIGYAYVRQLELKVQARTRELREALDRVAQSERSVRIAERMASIGTLAAGVAHEINNPLAYLCANVDFALEELRDASLPLRADRVSEVISALGEASEGALRVKNIVKDLKTFSRAESGPPGSVDVAQTFRTALNLSRNTLGQRAKVTVEISSVPSVRGEAGRLTQVLVNLLINAAQAIPSGAVDRNEIVARCELASDGWVVAEVRDTGSGITAENLQHIFDPFFTTKPVGVGTGLGLSICHGIVSAMGGRIDVESTIGKGTSFKIRLPPMELVDTGEVVIPNPEAPSTRALGPVTSGS